MRGRVPVGTAVTLWVAGWAAPGPGKAVTGRKGTLAKVTGAGCSGGGENAERVGSCVTQPKGRAGRIW